MEPIILKTPIGRNLFNMITYYLWLVVKKSDEDTLSYIFTFRVNANVWDLPIFFKPILRKKSKSAQISGSYKVRSPKKKEKKIPHISDTEGLSKIINDKKGYYARVCVCVFVCVCEWVYVCVCLLICFPGIDSLRTDLSIFHSQLLVDHQ